jgi:hypothetical protein
VRRILIALLAFVAVATVAPVRARADEQFTLTASYSGLYPGADVTVPVTVHNSLSYDLAVHTAAVTVGDAGPGCPAANLVAGSFAGDVVATAHHDATIPIRMQMPSSAPNGCQGATFPLTFTATGAPANGVPGDASGRGFAFTGAASLGTTAIGAAALVAGLLLLGLRRRATAEEAT